MSATCNPVFKVGISQLDSVVFCIGNYGVTVAILAVAFLLLLMMTGRRRER
jgi:hypothetical protein